MPVISYPDVNAFASHVSDIVLMFIVLLGSNDTIRSTIHRVRAPPYLTSADGMTPERYSIPYVSSRGLASGNDLEPHEFTPCVHRTH